MNTEEIVKKIITDAVFDDLSLDDIHSDTNLKSDLGIDSITLVSIMIDIEESFSISFESDVFEVYQMELFSVIIEQVTRLLEKKRAADE